MGKISKQLLKIKYEGCFVFMQKENSTIGSNYLSIIIKYLKKGYDITIVKEIGEFVRPNVLKKNK